jgi:hypothetical protein
MDRLKIRRDKVGVAPRHLQRGRAKDFLQMEH